MWFLSSVMVGILVFSPQARAGAPGAEKIVRRAEQVAYFQGTDGRADVEMLIIDAQKRERRRRLTILRRDTEGAVDTETPLSQKYYVYLHYPADVRDSVLMVWKHLGRDDDRWLYLPALDLVRRIAAGDKRTSFLGSDYFYEDISGRDIAQDSFQLESENDTYYVLTGTPKEPDTVEFSRYRMWIHKATYLPVKVEFLNARDQIHRVYEALAVEQIQGYTTVVHSRMTNMQTGTSSTLQFSGVRYDIGLEDKLFSERYLRNPPRSRLR